MRSLASALAALSVGLLVSSARAETGASRAADDREALLALATGATAAAVPLAIGGARAGRDELLYYQRDQGWVVAAAGLTLAPVAAHLVTREYARAAAFGAVPAATTVAITSLVSVMPKGIYTGNPGSRVSFTILFTTCAATSAIGVVDAAFGPERRRKRERPAPVSLDVGPGSIGLRGAW